MESTADLRRLAKISSRIWKHWAPSIVVFTVATAVVGLYVTDWKVTNTKIPYYGKKFEDEGNL